MYTHVYIKKNMIPDALEYVEHVFVKDSICYFSPTHIFLYEQAKRSKYLARTTEVDIKERTSMNTPLCAMRQLYMEFVQSWRIQDVEMWLMRDKHIIKG